MVALANHQKRRRAHILLWCGVNSTLFGKRQLDQPPVSALVYNMPAQLHRVFQVVQGG